MRSFKPLLLIAAFVAAPLAAQDTAEQTQRDRSYLTGLIEDNLSGEGRTVQIDGFSGALSSRATFDQMTISDADGAWLTIKDGAISWSRSALLKGAVEVDELSAASIDVPRLPNAAESAAPSPEATPFALPDLPVSIRLGKLDIKKLTLGAPILGEDLVAALSGSLNIADGEGQAKLDLSRTDKDAEIALTASFANSTRQLGIDLLMREAANGIIARKAGIPGAPALTLALAGSGPIDNFAANLRLSSDGAERLRGTVQISAPEEGQGTGFKADVNGDFAPLLPQEYRAFFGSKTALLASGTSGGDGQFSLKQFSVESAALKVSGAAEILSGGIPQSFDFDARVGLDGSRVLLPISGEETYVDKAQINLAYDRAKDDGWRLRGRVGGLKRSQGEIGSIILSGSGRIRAASTIPALGGTIRMTANQIALTDPALQEAVGSDVVLETIFSWRANEPLRLSKLALKGIGYSANGRIAFDNLAEGVDIALAIQAEHDSVDRLSALSGQNLGGSVRATLEGTATALTGAFDLKGDIIGTDLRSGIAQIDPILAGTSQINVDIVRDQTGVSLRTAKVSTRGVDATASGTLASSDTNITAAISLKNLGLVQADLRGAINAQAQLTGKDAKRDLTITATGTGLGTQVSAVNKLLAGALDLSIRVQEENGRVTLESANLENGQLKLAASGTIENGRHDITVDGRLANAALLAPGFPGPLTLNGTIDGTAERYSVDLNASGPGGTKAVISGGLDPALKSLDLGISGSTELALANAFIEPRSVQGPLGFDLAIRGPLALSSISGRIVASGARLVAPTLGLIFEDVDLTTELANSTAQINMGARLSTGGTVSVTGPIKLDAPNTADLKIALNSLILRDPELYETAVSGDVSINGPLTGGARIAGAISLAKTELRIPSTGISSIAEIPDLIHVGEPAAVRETRARAGLIETQSEAEQNSGPDFPIDLTISAPREIYVRGRGLDAELGGTLRVTGSTSNVVPVGQFSLIRGRIDILGKRFVLDDGQVALQGALTPWIRFVASTVSDDVTTTIQLEGDATEPEISLYSSPELPQEEVLARILFSRDVTSLSALQAAQLASAVASLAGKGGAGIIANLRESTGLDDLDVSTDDAGNAELTVGKYISEKVYTDVSVASDGTSQINLNLDVSPNVTARGSAGSDGDSGIGIFFEKDY